MEQFGGIRDSRFDGDFARRVKVLVLVVSLTAANPLQTAHPGAGKERGQLVEIALQSFTGLIDITQADISEEVVVALQAVDPQSQKGA